MWYRCSHFRSVSGATPVRAASAAMLSPAGIWFGSMPDYAPDMPEGDALHRAAKLLQVLAGQRVEVETPHPRAATKRLAERLDGKTLEGVEAIGKNLLLR